MHTPPNSRRELRRTVRGEVRFDRGSRALYATDASNYRQVPIGVVVPRDDDDVRAAVAACRAHHAPLLARGAGTSLAGQSCNVAVVLDFTKYMNRILELNLEAGGARAARSRARHVARPGGAAPPDVRPDPSTHSRCSLGGMIGNNSCGTHSLLAGKTVDNVAPAPGFALRRHGADGRRTSEAELDSIIRDGGRRGEIYAALRSIRERYTIAHSKRAFPEFPGECRGTTSMSSCRRTASTWPVRWWALKARARSFSKRPCVSSKARSIARSSGSVTPTPSQPPITFPRFSRQIPSGWRVSKAASSTDCTTRAPPISNCFRPEGVFSSSSSAQTTLRGVGPPRRPRRTALAVA